MEVKKNEVGDVVDTLDILGMRCRRFIADGNEKIAQVAEMVTAAKVRIDRDGEAFPGGFDHWIKVYVIDPPWSVPRLLTHGRWQQAKKTGEIAAPAVILAKVADTKAKTRSRSLERNKRAHAFSAAADAAPKPEPEPPAADPEPDDDSTAAWQHQFAAATVTEAPTVSAWVTGNDPSPLAVAPDAKAVVEPEPAATDDAAASPGAVEAPPPSPWQAAYDPVTGYRNLVDQILTCLQARNADIVKKISRADRIAIADKMIRHVGVSPDDIQKLREADKKNAAA
jgi:hypothetical protein